MSSIRHRITRTVVIGAAVAGLGLAASSTPANAAVGPLSAKLTVSDYKPGYHNVAVFGKVKMTRAEAEGFLASGHKVSLKLWGEDTFSDDLLLGPYNAVAYATDAGLEFHKVLLGQPDAMLDEDWGQDELYIGARLMSPTGSTVRSGETNRVTGRF
jgi:hypothetical protein